MNVIIAKDYAELSEKAARIIIDTVRQKPNAMLGLATGTTPLGRIQRFAERPSAKLCVLYAQKSIR